MIVRQHKPFDYGFTSITEQHGEHSDMILDFGILKLKEGDTEAFPPGRERAWLLIDGTITFAWEGKTETVTRTSCFDEAPYVLHVSKDTEVYVTTDSQYVMKGMTLWIHDWIRKNWKNSQKKPVLNKDLWEEMLKLSQPQPPLILSILFAS